MKVICQNCFAILADRNMLGVLTNKPKDVECVYQELNEYETLVTLVCPECECMTQVKA